jgi:hypothetical protein
MQTKIILSQVLSKLNELKQQIHDFEHAEIPELDQSEALYRSINEANKYVAAYCVLSNHKSVSPQVDIHLKVMSAANPIEEIKTAFESQSKNHSETSPLTQDVEKTIEIEAIEAKLNHVIENTEIISEPEMKNTGDQTQKEFPKIAITINDKFRLISELFKTNANEYNIAVEQLNACQSWDEAQVYLNNLQSIYQWDLDSEMVKRIFLLTQKRFL